jgi:hypothetical protein
MAINFNSAPYFDDYDESKKFLKVLFRPGFSLQARELTQLQSILQQQVTRMGDFVFKDRTIVIPGTASLDLKSIAVKLEETSPTDASLVNNFIGQFINQPIEVIARGITSGVTASVVWATPGDDVDPPTIFVKFTNSGKTGSATSFAPGEVVVVEAGESSYRVTVGPEEITPITNSSIAKLDQGIFYVNGYFVLVQDQTVILDKYSATPSYSVGVDIVERIVTPEEDESLYDNAQGTSNFTAPGAHRYVIDLVLTKYEVNEFGEDFIELFRVRRGQIENAARPFELAFLQDILAQRTFEESGDYAVVPFEVEIKEHRNNDRGAWVADNSYTVGDIVLNEDKYYVALTTGVSGTGLGPTHIQGSRTEGGVTWRYTNKPEFNFGLYGETEGDVNKLAIGVKSGLAYVKGYRAESFGTTYIDVNKARDFERAFDSGVSTPIGNLVDVNLEGSPNITQYEKVDLYEINTLVNNGTISVAASSKAVTLANIGAVAVGDVFISFSNTERYVFKANSSGTNAFTSLNASPRALTTQPVFRCTKIGEARIRYVDGRSTFERVSFYDIVLNDGKSFGRDVKVFSSQSQISDMLARGYIVGQRTPLPGAISITTAGAVTGSATEFTSSLKVGDVVVAEGGQHFLVTAVTNDTNATVKPNPAVLINTVKYNRLEAPLQEPENNDLIFELPASAVRKVRGGTNDEVFGTTYTVMRRFNAVTDGGSPATLSISVSEPNQFISSDIGDYIVIAAEKDGSTLATGEVMTPTSVTVVSSQEVRITLAATSTIIGNIAAVQSRRFEIFAPVRKRINGALEKTKKLVSTFIDITSQPTALSNAISLGQADIYRVTKVEMHPTQTFGIANLNTLYDSDNNPLGGVVDITENFTVDDGQKDTHYDLGRLIRGSAVPAPTAPFRVFFEFFEHSQTGDYFSVDSYVDLLYEEIPSFTSKLSGRTVQLRDSLDFRPRVGVNGNYISTGASISELPKRGTGLECDFSYYLPRKDKIVLTKNGEFKVIEGVSSESPTFPPDPKEVMLLYEMTLSPYTFGANVESVKTKRIDHKRYTMGDIGRLERRIENLESAVSLSLLERDTANLVIKDADGLDRFKNGFVVDNFASTSVGNVSSTDYKCAIDLENKELRPMFHQDIVQFVERASTLEERINSNYRVEENIITLPYFSGPDDLSRIRGEITTLRSLPTRSGAQDFQLESLQRDAQDLVVVEQPQATVGQRVAAAITAQPVGQVVLFPSSDEWIETTVPPELVVNQGGTFDSVAARADALGISYGTLWNQWQITQLGRPRVVENIRVSSTRVRGGTIVVDAQILAATANETRSGVSTDLISDTEVVEFGGRLTARSSISYIRSRPIVFTASGMRPGTRHYAFLDDVDVSQYCQQATQLLLDTRVPDYSQSEFVGGPVRDVYLEYDTESNIGNAVRSGSRLFTGNLRNDTRESLDNFAIVFGGNDEVNPTELLAELGTSPGASSGFGAENDPARQIIRAGSVQTCFQRGEVIRGRTTGTTAIVVLHEQSIDTVRTSRTFGYADGKRDVLHVVNVRFGPNAPTTIDPITRRPVVQQTGFLDNEEIEGSFLRTLPNGQTKRLVTKLRAFRATQTPASGSLITSGQGRIAGIWLLTSGQVIGNRVSPKFLTGRRIFSLSNDVRNRPANRTSYADTIYEAVGIIEPDKGSFISVRNGYLTTRDVAENRTREVTVGTRRRETFIADPPRGDPLAQSFFVNDETGCFVTHLDLFFKKKPGVPVPVIVEIVEMVNGFPGSITVPFGKKFLYPSQINIDATRGTARTTVKFDAPIYLCARKEYCVMLTTASTEYEVWVAQLGQRDLVTNATVNLQPTLGTMFLSQNASTWTPDQNKDLKFILYKAKFLSQDLIIGESKVEFVNSQIPFMKLPNNPIRTQSGQDEFFIYQPNHGMIETAKVTLENVPSSQIFGFTRDVNTLTDTVFDLGGDTGVLNGEHVVHKVYSYDVYSIKLTTNNNTIFGGTTGFFGGSEIRASRNLLFTTFHPNFNILRLPGTDVKFRVKSTTGKSPTGSETPFIFDNNSLPCVVNDNNYYDEQRIVLSDENQNLKNAGQPSFVIEAVLTSSDTRITPMIDLARTSAIVVQNRVDDPLPLKNSNTNYIGATNDGSEIFVSEYEPVDGVASSKYISKNLVFANNSRSVRVQFAANIPTASRVNSEASTFRTNLTTTNGSKSLGVLINELQASTTAAANPVGATTILLAANPTGKVANGYFVYGRGIPAGTTVTGFTTTSITISAPLELQLLTTDYLYVSPLNLSTRVAFSRIEVGDAVTGQGIASNTNVISSLKSSFFERRIALGAGAGVAVPPEFVTSVTLDSVQGVKVGQIISIFLPVTGFASSNERGRNYAPLFFRKITAVDPTTRTVTFTAIDGGTQIQVPTKDQTNYPQFPNLITNGNLADLNAANRLAPNRVFIFQPEVVINKAATASTALNSTESLTFTSAPGAPVEVYYKLAQSGGEPIDNVPYFRALPENGVLPTENNETSFTDVTFTVNSDVDFNIAVVKIVFRSRNPAFVPRIKDLRIVALA